MYNAFRKVFASVPEITVKELLEQQQQQEKILLVDIRQRNEQRISMLPEAITQQQFEQNQEKYLDYQIVCYCTIGYRSGLYAKKLLPSITKIELFKYNDRQQLINLKTNSKTIWKD